MKKWIALMLVIAICGSLLACGGNKDVPEKVEDFSGQTLRLGSQMPNFTIQDVAGNEYTLYDVLEEKKMVMLNFWFVDCPYCVMEFPHIEKAYAEYKDSVQILAVNPVDSDGSIVKFQAEEKLTFAMCGEDLGMKDAFGVKAYPTTVIIDRYGMVCLIHVGAVPSDLAFVQAFSFFTADDYETTLFERLTEIGV